MPYKNAGTAGKGCLQRTLQSFGLFLGTPKVGSRGMGRILHASKSLPLPTARPQTLLWGSIWLPLHFSSSALQKKGLLEGRLWFSWDPGEGYSPHVVFQKGRSHIQSSWGAGVCLRVCWDGGGVCFALGSLQASDPAAPESCGLEGAFPMQQGWLRSYSEAPFLEGDSRVSLGSGGSSALVGLRSWVTSMGGGSQSPGGPGQARALCGIVRETGEFHS